MISINYRDPHPLYEQVKDGFCQLMVKGILDAGDKLPSVRELATQLAINPNTIQRAYREMESEGYIFSLPGRGSFVSDTAAVRSGKRDELLRTFDDLVSQLFILGISCDALKTRIECGAASSGGGLR